MSAVAEARRILQPEVSVQIQAADFPEWTLDLIEAGADDIGDIPLQGSAEQYAAIVQWEKDLGVKLARQGIALNYRLPLFPASIVKGLYPTSIEARIDHALTSLRNGASPKHPAPLQKSSPIPISERRIPPHKAALRLRKAAAAMTAISSAAHKAPFAQGHPAPRVAPGKKAAHAPHPLSSAHAPHPKSGAHAQHAKSSEHPAPRPRPLANTQKAVLPTDPPTQRLK